MGTQAAENIIKLLASETDRDVRVFRDLGGDLSVATLEDILIKDAEEPRLLVIKGLLPYVSESFLDELESYEGSLVYLVNAVVREVYGEAYGISELLKKERTVHKRLGRTLRQKEGSKRGGRTRMRRMYYR